MVTEKPINIARLLTISLITMELFLYPNILVLAEDYPKAYMGPGYREYISGKIQNGYYVETFSKIDMRQKERVNKRNEVERILTSSYQAAPISTNAIAAADSYQKESTRIHDSEIAQQNKQREKNAAAELASGFTYIPGSDGKITYFKDGLPCRIENERVVDEFGNLSIKNTDDMQYNDRRLLISYAATLTDNLGNTSRLFWYGARYSEDSVYYANKETNANKNMLEYYMKEIDSAGNTKTSHWNALSYDGKLARSYHQRIEDSIYGIMDFTRTNVQYDGNDPERPTSYHEEGVGQDGLYYTSDRSDTAYNEKGQITAYHEEKYITQVDGKKTKVTTDTKIVYLHVPDQFGSDVEDRDPDRPIEIITKTTTENPDGSIRTETTTNKYEYENYQIVSGTSHSDFTGQEGRWYQYTDNQGHILSKNVTADGQITYSYIDPQTLKAVVVSENQVTATLKDGNKFTGSSDTEFEILYGKIMNKEIRSHTSYYGRNISDSELIKTEDSTVNYTNGMVNNLQKVLTSTEHTVISNPLIDPDGSHRYVRDNNLTYIYNKTTGNLMDIESSGTAKGWEYQPTRGWYGRYGGQIIEDWTVILGKPVKTDSYEYKHYED